MKKILTLFLLVTIFPINVFAEDILNVNLNSSQVKYPAINVLNIIAYGDDFLPKEEYQAGDSLKGAMQIISSDERFFSDVQYSTYLELYSTSTMPSSSGFLLATSTFFDIAPNETITNPISVKLPENIGGDGLYTLRIEARLRTGQWLGSSKSQPFKIIGGEKLFSINNQAVVTIDKEGNKTEYNSLIGPSIYKDKNPDRVEINFSVFNQQPESKELKAKIYFNKLKDSSKKNFSEIYQDIKLEPGTSTKFSISLPTFEYIPGTYIATLQLVDSSGRIHSAETNFTYLVEKELINGINYAYADKVLVSKNEKINITTGYYSYLSEDTLGATSTKPFDLKISLFNELGDLIGQSSKNITEGGAKEIVFEITALKNAKALKAQVVMSRGENVTDVQEFTLTQNFEKIAEQSKKDHENFISIIVLIISIVTVIIIILIFFLFLKKNKKIPKVTYSLFLLLLVVSSFSFLGLNNNVWAWWGAIDIDSPVTGQYFYSGDKFGISAHAYRDDGCGSRNGWTSCQGIGSNYVIDEYNHLGIYEWLRITCTSSGCNVQNMLPRPNPDLAFHAGGPSSNGYIAEAFLSGYNTNDTVRYKTCAKNIDGGMIYMGTQCSTCTVTKSAVKVGEVVTYNFSGLTNNAYYPLNTYFTWNKPSAFVSSASNKGVSYSGSYNAVGTYKMTMTNSFNYSVYGGGTATCPAVTVSNPVNGVCGTANNRATLTAPTSNLCNVGSPSVVTTGASSFTWSCAGTGGGTSASCSAPRTYTTVNGSCGTAKKTYANTATSYGSDTFCAAGTASPTTPAFPAKGSSQTWQCLGTGTVPGTSISCTASRNADTSCTGPDGTVISSGSSKTYYSSNSSANCGSLAQVRTCNNGSLSGTATFASCSAPTVNGSCGTADKTNKIYANTATSYGSDTFCAAGTASPTTPAFPAKGGEQYWQCLGTGAVPGTTATCSAKRNDDPPATTCSIPTPNPNNISICSQNKICSTSGMCNNLTNISGSTKVTMRMTPNITSSNVCSVYWELTSDQNTVFYCGVFNSNNSMVTDQNSGEAGFQVNTGTYSIKCFSDQVMTNLVTSSTIKTCVKNPEVKEI